MDSLPISEFNLKKSYVVGLQVVLGDWLLVFQRYLFVVTSKSRLILSIILGR